MKNNKDVVQNNFKISNKHNPPLTIHYVDGLCGAGKTYGLGQFIKKTSLHQKFIITTPSKALADQIYKQLDDLGIGAIQKIYSQTGSRSSNVPAQIMAAIRDINVMGQGVIICTQQVFPKLQFIENQNEWVLIVDEIPKVDNFAAPSLPYNHHLLSHYVEAGEVVGTGLYEIHPSAERLGHNQDAVNDVFKPIVDDLYDEHYRCYTDKANWDKLVERNQVTEDSPDDYLYGNELNKLYFLSLLQPPIYQGFAQVIMMGANFEQSLLYRYWSDYCSVVFRSFTPIVQQLRYYQYSNGDRLTLRYLQEADWSKYSANKLIKGKTKLDYFAEVVARFMGEREFIYMTNNDDTTAFRKGRKAPVISHGINHFDTFNDIYFSPALNNQPKHTAMLIDLGFDKVFIKRAMSYEVAHQAIMRTSLRRPDSTAPVTAIVSDKSTAEAIARLFPQCHIGPIDGCLKKVVALTQVEKNSKSRLKKLIDLKVLNSVVLTALNNGQQANNHHVNDFNDKNMGPITADNLTTNCLSIGFSTQDLPEINDVKTTLLSAPINADSDSEDNTWDNLGINCLSIGSSTQNLPNPPEFLDMSFGVSFLSSIYNKSLAVFNSSPMEFVKTMQSIYTNHIISTKDESVLFNGVTYKTEQSRALSNVDYASLVVVDIDDGDLSPEEFKAIFTQKTKHSFFMCNSFSRSEAKPNNYRVVFFIKQVVTDEIYREVQAYIQRIIAQQGYITCWSKDRAKHLDKNSNAKFSGIDLSKTHTASFFYLPCKVQNRLDWSFFWRGNLKDEAQLTRYAIDVEKVIQYAVAMTELAELIYESPVRQGIHSDNRVQEVIDLNAIKTIIKQGDFKHLGDHHTYGRMAAAMNDAGFTESDFIELTPFISRSKTAKDASKSWHSWKGYSGIKKGTLFHLIGMKKTH